MNDYLDSLVAKSLGVGETIQPRPVSLFEPLPGLAALPSRLPTEIAQEGLVPRETAPGFLHPAGAPLSPPASADRPVIWPAFDEGRALQPPQPAEVDAADLAAGRAPSPLVVQRRVPLPPSQPVEGAASGEPVPTAGMAGRLPAQGTGAQSIAHEHFVPPVIVERSLPAAKEAKTEGQTERSVLVGERVKPTPSPGVIARPQVKRVADVPVPGQAQSTLQPEPAPTVQVTIGRIEVRAAPPAEVAAQKTPRPKPMSLDEYLRQRRGGKP